mgnify:CR=1 FL=1
MVSVAVGEFCKKRAIEIARDRTIVPAERNRNEVYSWFSIRLKIIADTLKGQDLRKFVSHNHTTLAGMVFVIENELDQQQKVAT